MRRSTSAVSKGCKLPGLSKSSKLINHNIDDVTQLKLKNQQMDLEIRQLRAKTARMKQVLLDRNCSIKNALSKSQQSPSLQTASNSTISQLKINIQSLENTFAARQEELNTLQFDDRTSLSDELQTEIMVYYAEYQRLSKQSRAVKEGIDVITQERTRIVHKVDSMPESQQEIAQCQKEIDELADKLHAYRSSELRIEASNYATKIAENPARLKGFAKEVEDKITELDRQIADEEKKVGTIQENEQKNIQFLQKIIDEQRTKIRERANVLHDEVLKERQAGGSAPAESDA